jgi:hypothetical protein
MQDQGEVLRHLRAEHQARIPADLELRFEAADFAADEIVEANAVPHRIGDRTVGGGHGLQPIHQALLDRRLPDHAFAGQAEADDRLDHGKQILDAMMQLFGQKYWCCFACFSRSMLISRMSRVLLMKSMNMTQTVASNA